MNKNLRIGISSGVSFGGAMGAFAFFRTGKLLPTLIGAATGVFFGAFMAWFSSIGDRRLKAMGIDATDLNPLQVRRVSYPGPPGDAMEASKQALQGVRKLKKVSESQDPPSLKASTGFTFEGIGENILIEFTPGETGTVVAISSKPKLTTTEMDMGKGVENVETVVRYLEKRGARRVA